MNQFPHLSRAFVVALAASTVLASGVTAGCSQEAESDHPSPLQPLIYTEYPDLTPQGAAVRERRLVRQLLEGVDDGPGDGFDEASSEPLPSLVDAEQLGNAIAQALIERDERLWEHLFVSPEHYAQMTGVTSSSAGEFVDNQIGESMQLWQLFEPEHSSILPDGGLAAQVEFHSLQLGSARRVDGGAAGQDDDVAQYFNSQLVIRHVDAEVKFEFSIPRIFRIEVGDDATEEPLEEGEWSAILRLASPIEIDRRFATYLSAGLHLKPQLLRAQEHPFPLGVGSFWRYRRYDARIGTEGVDPLEQRLEDAAEGIASEEVIVEVREVSRYGSWRLVEILRSYDDRDYTRVRQWWLQTPRRLYICDDACRQNIDDLSWLLTYLDRRAPILKFPLRVDQKWAAGGRPEEDRPLFSVERISHEVDTPAGTFFGAYRIEGSGDLGLSDPYATDAEVARYFIPERGVVRRTLINSGETDSRPHVIEELIQYRLMH